MRFSFKNIWSWLLLLTIGLVFWEWSAQLASAQDGLKAMADNLEQTKQGMTLWETIKTGGFTMWILAALSVGALAMIIYNFFALNMNAIVPKQFSEDLIKAIEQGKASTAKNMCQSDANAISNIATVGLAKKDSGGGFARESMESCARKEISLLWQNISYLADIAAIAPLVGLFGTVLGMIQAFNVIAFQAEVVKPILLAAGVSKAMVTTAGGLAVAIPVMLFYSYFRGKVQNISNAIERYSTDLIKVVEES